MNFSLKKRPDLLNVHTCIVVCKVLLLKFVLLLQLVRLLCGDLRVDIRDQPVFQKLLVAVGLEARRCQVGRSLRSRRLQVELRLLQRCLQRLIIRLRAAKYRTWSGFRSS